MVELSFVHGAAVHHINEDDGAIYTSHQQVICTQSQTAFEQAFMAGPSQCCDPVGVDVQ